MDKPRAPERLEILEIPPNPQEAEVKCAELKNKGNQHFRNKEYERAVDSYNFALLICSEHKQCEKEAAKLHSNLAAVFLEIQDTQKALYHANKCIELDKDFCKGYFRRAKAYAQLALSKEGQEDIDSDVKHAIEDYLKCYRMLCSSGSHEVEPLCQAVMLAVSVGCPRALDLHKESLSPLHSAQLIKTLIKKPNSEARHLKYLLANIEEERSEESHSSLLNGWSCSAILRMPDLDGEILSALLDLGATVRLQDAAETLHEDQLELVKMITNRSAKPQIDEACKKSLKCKKWQFIAYFISCGAKPPVAEMITALEWKELHESVMSYLVTESSESERAVLLRKTIEEDNFQFANKILSSGPMQEIGISSLLESTALPMYPEMVQLILEKSASEPERAALICKAIIDDDFTFASNILNSGPIQCDEIDIASLIESTSLPMHPETLQALLEKGVSPNGTGSTKPIDAVLSLDRYSSERKIPLIRALVENRADLHIVTGGANFKLVNFTTKLALETGDTQALEAVCERFPFPTDRTVVDKDFQTPWHLALDAKCDEKSKNVCRTLAKYRINPNVQNKQGRRPDHRYAKKESIRDERVLIMQEVEKTFKESQTVQHSTPKSKRKKDKNRGDKKSPTPQDFLQERKNTKHSQPQTTEYPIPSSATKSKNSAQPQAPSSLRAKLKECLQALHSKPDEYFVTDDSKSRDSQTDTPSLQNQISTGDSVKEPPEINMESTAVASEIPNEGSSLSSVAQPPIEMQQHSDEDTEAEEINFDGQPWEIVFTKSVMDFFKDKKVNSGLKRLVISKISMLAQGDWHSKKVCKKLGNTPGVELYETRATDAVRILWQVAIEFSARCTSFTEEAYKKLNHEGHVYSEVIRVWNIVCNHDKIHHYVQQIERSNVRGSNASVQIPLQAPLEQSENKCNAKRIPRRYLMGPKEAEKRLRDDAEKLQIFIPPASTKDNEYNVVQFWSLHDAMIKSLLEGKNVRRDFPYNGWPNEHDIINAPAEEAIILLGRSGTGKTTCCLYRMWNHFQTYWSKTGISDPQIPRTPLLLSHARLPQKVDCAAENVGSGVPPEESESDHDMESTSDEQHDHLHQVFITKNYVLCAQMKKHFYNLAAGCDIAEAHMKYEDQELPHSLSRIEELAYPLFLTARQFFILLDNSLGTERTFFPREDDGSLKVEILSSDYDHEDPDTLLDLEESATESEDEGELAFHEEFAGRQATSKKQRREVTASYFVEEMWPKIAHTDNNMDPILVWTEIKTFIKGSRKALESSCAWFHY